MFGAKKKKPRIGDAKREVHKLKCLLQEETKGCTDISELETKDMASTIEKLLKEEGR